jgi:YjbE family integral membrane protein
MESSGNFFYLGTSLQVFFIDLLVSGDNAMVIALACRSLPPRRMRKAILFGTVAAIVLRVFFTTLVSFLLDVPCLKLAGALVLVVIAVKLIVSGDEHLDERGRSAGGGGDLPDVQEQTFWSAVIVVVVADAVMSLDNVVALAAVAQGSVFFLTLGLLASIPLLMYGSLIVTGLLRRYPVLIPAGGALLGWVAGDIAVSDPAISGWAATQAPALAVALPPLGAVYVLLQSRIIEREQKTTPERTGDFSFKLAGAMAHFLGAKRSRPSPESTPAESLQIENAFNHPSSAPATGLPEKVPGAEARILVAAGDPVEQEWFATAIHHLGQTADHAYDGDQALAKLSRGNHKLCIIDRLLPGIDGVALAARIRVGEEPTGQRLQIILLTEEEQAFTTQQLFDAGLDDALVRPLTEENLRAVLTFWLTAAGVTVEHPRPTREARAPDGPEARIGIAGLLKKSWRFLRKDR